MADTRKKLNDLRVIDLRVELEKRGLDKSGVRAVLLKRLTKAIKDEGHDPETYTIVISGTEPKTPSKRTSRSESVVEGEEESPMDVNVDDMVVQDEVAEDDDKESDSGEKEEQSEQEESNQTVVEVKESPKKAPKRENTQEPDATDAKRQCREETEEEELLKENEKKNCENTAEVEDSINLDLGEDELLNDETDSTAKTKQDEGGETTTASGAGDADPDAGAAPETTPSVAVDDADADNKEQKSNMEDSKNTSESQDSQKDTSDNKDDKDEGRESVEGKPQENRGQGSGAARNLWVSGLSGNTRAKDLKQLCSKHGKVIGAKVVTNARTPGSRCYGFVTLASSADAESCIKNLHRTELHGRMISVEKAKSDATAVVTASGSSRRPAPSSSRSRHPTHRREGDKDDTSGKEKQENGGEVKSEVKEGENGEVGTEGAEEVVGEEAKGEEGGEGGEDGKKEVKKEVKKEGTAKSHTSTDKKRHSSDRHDKVRNDKRIGRRASPRNVLSFSKIMKERDLQRVRERGRNNREEERRRREAEELLRERERRQRQEKQRLQIEREKLRVERERIEREKNDLLRLERERHKLEREKLELERLELKREQQRLEAVRGRTLKSAHSGYPASTSNSYDRSARDRKPGLAPQPAYERDPPRHKRPLPPAQPTSGGRGGAGGYEMRTPSPPRFGVDPPAYENKQYSSASRHQLSTASGMKYSANGTSSDSRQPMPPGTRAKDQGRRGGGGYGLGETDSSARRSRERPSAYRDSRITSPPSKTTTWQSSHAASRYDMPSQSATKDYGERVSSSNWHGSSSSSKGYTSARQPASSAPSNPWSGGAGGAASGGSYDTRYPSTVYQPPPPGAAPYAQQESRYAPASRDYRPKY